MKNRHTLPKIELLRYALSGALMERGVLSGQLDDEDEELLDRDIAEIERRIKLVNIAERKKEAS